MMANSLSPAFVRINYQSAFAIHTMTIPTVGLIPPAILGNPPAFALRGANIPVSVAEAVPAFINVIKAHFPSSVSFIDYMCFSQPTPTDIATPLYGSGLGVTGTAGSPGWHKAVQSTITWRTEGFGIFKLVFLDCGNFGSFDKITVFGDSVIGNIHNYVTSSASFLSGRDGDRPVTFLQQAFTLNEKLRRSYGMN